MRDVGKGRIRGSVAAGWRGEGGGELSLGQRAGPWTARWELRAPGDTCFRSEAAADCLAASGRRCPLSISSLSVPSTGPLPGAVRSGEPGWESPGWGR